MAKNIREIILNDPAQKKAKAEIAANKDAVLDRMYQMDKILRGQVRMKWEEEHWGTMPEEQLNKLHDQAWGRIIDELLEIGLGEKK